MPPPLTPQAQALGKKYAFPHDALQGNHGMTYREWLLGNVLGNSKLNLDAASNTARMAVEAVDAALEALAERDG